ncbi:hypothetical protein [Gryllotalpicola protaetiae]|uniref:Uncharacterized protein n=1 Tax=Gryllotalpicola protaetiae TaxID=2419771 RepID=A0A387BME9_9MICO|nr:hypothetical protein [Gryllotalpicola protaetiae]AYG02379.1 hypothetical protein D7I44_01740 [Gryllotalpicola protaetiae]
MALTAKQRNALPNSAFAYPDKRLYPIPTKHQAQQAGISEQQRLGLHRNAMARVAQRHTRGAVRTVAKVVARRSGIGQSKEKAGKTRRGRR